MQIVIQDPLDLHALANMPGAGKARRELKARGLWDETVEEGELRSWRATVWCTTTREETITVEAVTEEMARKKARQALEDDFDEVDVWDVKEIAS